MNLLLGRVELNGRGCDVRVREQRIFEVADRLSPSADEDVVDAGGAALLPGLHDHHIHLLATAAAAASVPCGPPDVTDVAALARALQEAASRTPDETWIRGVGYIETVAADLDRHLLDRLLPDRPVRVQHRSGALWTLNTAGLRAAHLEQVSDPDVERDAAGSLTGRLYRYDAQLRARLAGTAPPDLAALSQRLSSYGITGVTDATPDLDADALRLLSGTVTSGAMTQQLVLLGAPDDAELPAGLLAGPRKILLPDHALPPYDEIEALIKQSHAADRPVAVHCVTRESLLLTLAALKAVGPLPGDRIEHAAVAPPESIVKLAALGVAVVTQPSFLVHRGDDYLRDVDEVDVPCLYPYASLVSAGVAVGPSSDAPYGDLNPWCTIAAARERTTASGAVLGPDERVETRIALEGFLSEPSAPGGEPRRVHAGATADLCLLDGTLRDVLAEPSAERVRLVLRGGDAVFSC